MLEDRVIVFMSITRQFQNNQYSLTLFVTAQHRRKDSKETLLDRKRSSGSQEKLGNLIRLRLSLRKWPFDSCSTTSLEGGLDVFLRDLSTKSYCFPVFIS